MSRQKAPKFRSGSRGEGGRKEMTAGERDLGGYRQKESPVSISDRASRFMFDLAVSRPRAG
jgi:hypothetical protein